MLPAGMVFTSRDWFILSNLRVRALTGSFGGFRNRITYEIDGNKLEYGDQIEGSFYLVTNGGEKEIPYSFRVQNSASGKTLDCLKKVSDFGDMAREDFDMAMRIFEYRDFTKSSIYAGSAYTGSV